MVHRSLNMPAKVYVPHMQNPWTYGARLREIREAKKLTQDEAARRIGVSELSYGNWERGKQAPTDENLKEIARVFKVDPRELGYRPPQGWELVPAEWIRQRFDRIDAALADLKTR